MCVKLGCPGVDLFELFGVVLGVGIPYGRTVLKCWSYMCVVKYVFEVRSTVMKISPREPQSSTFFVCDKGIVC